MTNDSSRRMERMRAWVEGGSLVDENGDPRVWYHGTVVEAPFDVFTNCDEGSIGFHFGDAGVASTRIEHMIDEEEIDGAQIVPVVCRARNPLVLDDLYTWGSSSVLSALVEAGVVSEEEADEIDEDGLFELDAIYAFLEEAGYDAILYRNETEADVRTGSLSLIVWRAELLKSPWSIAFDPTDPRLQSQWEASTVDMDAWSRNARGIDEERAVVRRRRDARPAAPTP